MRVFEHCEAWPAPCGGGAVTRSMRRVAHPTFYRFRAGAGARVITDIDTVSKTDIKYISGRAEYFLLER